jgi:flagellin
MSLVINTNTQSLFAQRALNSNTANLKVNLEHLSTGYRINRAADDAAGLSISNKLSTTIRGLEKAKQNAADGISLLQTAEGGLSVIQENIQRIRELFIQAVNGTNGEPEKSALQREINERVKTIDDISSATKFNGISLLKGSSNYILQTGSDNGQITTLNFQAETVIANTGIKIDISEDQGGIDDSGHLIENVSLAGFALDEISVGSSTVAAYDNMNFTLTAGGVDILDTIIGNISRMRSYIGASQNALESKIEYIDVAIENNSSSRSRIQDIDVAQESSILVRNQILQQTSSTMLSQANSQPQIAVSLLGQ